MTEEFDEEVVFENSPLFQYLQDLGHWDFEACPAEPQGEEGGAGEGEGSFPQDVLAPLRRGLFWRLADAVWRLSSVRQDSMSSRVEQRLDAEFRQYSLRTLMEQDVLLQEDIELIELLDPSVLSAGSSPSHAAATPGNRFLAAPSVWDLSGLVAFVAVLVGLRVVGEGLGLALLVPWALALLALAGFVLVRGAGLLGTARLRRGMRDRGAQLERLALDSRALTGLARRSLRLIQETEVISRGFTLVSAACPLSKAGQHRGQQLLGLRKASYRALRSAFRASRLATCHMLKSYPLNSEIDNVTNYLSTVPLKELGLGLGEVHLTEEQAQELTDDYSLPALKVLFQLWVGQSSEFFRRLVLLLSPAQEEPPREPRGEGGAREKQPADVQLMNQVVAEVTGPLRHALSGCLGDLQRSYDFHRYFETQHQSQGSDRNGRARQKCRDLNALHTSVRSLQLHLKALLNEVIILEDELEKLMVSRETVEMVCAEELQDRLQLLQPHMQASCGCWEETVMQVDRMLHRAANSPGTPITPEERTPPLPVPPPRPMTLIQDRDPVPEEQELEAYASDSDSDSDSEWRGPLLDLLPPEERERQRLEREESRRVLLELKAVLGLRASEVERQKWKQLLFSDQAALRAAVAMELSEPHRTYEPPEPQSQQNNHTRSQPEEAPRFCPAETQFSCGHSEGGRDAPHAPGAGVTLRYQHDGTVAEGEEREENGTERPLVGRVSALTVTDRLTERHVSTALGFSPALAVQVATRSHSFTNMEEQTFGNEEEEVEERERPVGEEEVTSQS